MHGIGNRQSAALPAGRLLKERAVLFDAPIQVSASCLHSQRPERTEPRLAPKRWGEAVFQQSRATASKIENQGIPRSLTQIISKANYGFVLCKCCDKDFNFTLCQEFYGAKKLSSTEHSCMNPTEIRRQKQQSLTITFGVKILIKTN